MAIFFSMCGMHPLYPYQFLHVLRHVYRSVLRYPTSCFYATFIIIISVPLMGLILDYVTLWDSKWLTEKKNVITLPVPVTVTN